MIGRSLPLLGLLGMTLMASGAARGGAALDPDGLALERVATDLDRPVLATAPPGDARLFIVQATGQILILEHGEVLDTPFLDVSGDLIRNLSSFDERGLLGLAFPPDFAQSGCFFIYYTNQNETGAGSDRVEVARYRVSEDPDVADEGSGEVFLTVDQPFPNHNGGHIQFRPPLETDPPGTPFWLYVGTGDGGSGNDPFDRARDDGSRLGKLLRYAVDCENPLPVLQATPAPSEIWAKGLRNPYRWSFDRETADVYLADVGQNRWEEVDVESAASPGGRDYGWRDYEASECNRGLAPDERDCSVAGLTFPVYEFPHQDNHTDEPQAGGSVIGGYVYRGAIEAIRGHYFFADFTTAEIWTFVWDGADGILDLTNRSARLVPDQGQIRFVSGFGEDGYGELYVASWSGRDGSGDLFRVVPEPGPDLLRATAVLSLSMLAGRRTSRPRRWDDSPCRAGSTTMPPGQCR